MKEIKDRKRRKNRRDEKYKYIYIGKFFSRIKLLKVDLIHQSYRLHVFLLLIAMIQVNLPWVINILSIYPR